MAIKGYPVSPALSSCRRRLQRQKMPDISLLPMAVREETLFFKFVCEDEEQSRSKRQRFHAQFLFNQGFRFILSEIFLEGASCRHQAVAVLGGPVTGGRVVG